MPYESENFSNSSLRHIFVKYEKYEKLNFRKS